MVNEPTHSISLIPPESVFKSDRRWTQDLDHRLQTPDSRGCREDSGGHVVNETTLNVH